MCCVSVPEGDFVALIVAQGAFQEAVLTAPLKRPIWNERCGSYRAVGVRLLMRAQVAAWLRSSRAA
jgi:hypothetical protein